MVQPCTYLDVPKTWLCKNQKGPVDITCAAASSTDYLLTSSILFVSQYGFYLYKDQAGPPLWLIVTIPW